VVQVSGITGAWVVRDLKVGFCLGCHELGPLPKFGDGLCFLCATAGAPGDTTPTGRRLGENEEVVDQVLWPGDEEVERRLEIVELFADAQRQDVRLSLDYSTRMEGFCFSGKPNARTQAIWTRRRPRPEPEDLTRVAEREARVKARAVAVRERIRKRCELTDLRRSFYRVTLHDISREPTVMPILMNGQDSAADSFLNDVLNAGFTSITRTLVKKYAPSPCGWNRKSRLQGANYA
jgi:hypothetical protein